MCPDESTVVNMDRDVVCTVISLMVVTGTLPVVEVRIVVAVANRIVYKDVSMLVRPDESTAVNVDSNVVCSVTSVAILIGIPPVVEVGTVVAVTIGVRWKGAYVAGIVMFAFGW